MKKLQRNRKHGRKGRKRKRKIKVRKRGKIKKNKINGRGKTEEQALKRQRKDGELSSGPNCGLLCRRFKTFNS
jgi:hypothetical protein